MKFLCPNCKAKYQIADEKVSGRTLRMDCRRCGHNITIRADMRLDEAEDVELGHRPVGDGPSVRPAGAARGGSVVGPNPLGSQRAPRPAGLTGAHAPAAGPGAMGSSALGADFRRNVSSAPEAPRTTPLDQWHVAINDVPVGPLRREEILRKMATGAVRAESLCWREGLDDWRPLRDIPELAALLRRSLAPEPAGRAPVTRGPAAAPPRAAPAAPRAAPAGRPPTGRSNVVPIGGRLGASAAALDEHEVDDGTDEPTRVGSVDLAELEARAVAAEREAKRASEEAKAEAKLAESKAAEAKAAELRAAEAKAAELRAAEAKAAEKPAEPAEGKRPPTGRIATRPIAPPPKPLGRPDTGKVPLGVPPKPAAPPKPEPEPEDELPIAAPSFAQAAPEPAPLAAPAALAAPALAAPPAPALAPAPAIAAPKEKEREERRGMPVGAWIAIAGAVSFGGVLAVMVGNHFLNTPAAGTPAAAVVQPATPQPEAPAAPVAEVTPPPAPVEEPVAEAPAVATPTEPTPEAPHAGTTTPRRTTTGGGATTAATSATSTPSGATATTKAPSGRFADFADSPSGAGPAAIPTGSPRSLVDDAEGPAARSGQSELTADQIRAVITRERPALNRCWESELRRIGQAATVRLDVDLSIGGSGTVTSVTTRGQSVGTLSDCIERNVRRWRFPPVSGSTQTSFPLVFSGTE
jgi:predicted Zn finger-like uncharacterized protein